jgi:23S rRNA pseudouridine2605 synthase
MMLPRGLKRGAWVELDQADIQALMSAAGVKERAPVERNNGGARGANNRGGRNNRSGGRGNGMNADRAPQGVVKAVVSAVASGTAIVRHPAACWATTRATSPAAAPVARALAGGGQPDPMRTSVGYIGSDSLSRARQNAKRRPGGGGGGAAAAAAKKASVRI